jgi:hypothetical protein
MYWHPETRQFAPEGMLHHVVATMNCRPDMSTIESDAVGNTAGWKR